jgi:predicted O-linked N-acetylglucosamine transferase (SPINDLY family)
VQLTYLGFPGSTGLPGVDYVIADEFLITRRWPSTSPKAAVPAGHLPDQRPPAPDRRCPNRASSACRTRRFVFCSFNNNKFTPELFAVWMNILRRVPGSVLWLVADFDVVRENLWRYAEQAGIDRSA